MTNLIFPLISLICTAVTAALTLVMLFTFRKERPVGVLSLLISGFLNLILLPVFILLSGAQLNLVVGLPLLAIGLLIGVLRGFATKLMFKEGRVVGKHAVVFLVGWGLSMVLAQLLTMAESRLLAAVGLMPLTLSTGTQLGITGNLLLRRAFMRCPKEVRV